MSGALRVEHVAVTAGETQILRDVCLRVPAGSVTALVGRSGAGFASNAEIDRFLAAR